MKSLFIVTSALNTKFGVHPTDLRLNQTIDTINSIKKYAPGAKIAVIEMSGAMSPTEEQLKTLYLHANYVLDFTQNEAVKGIYNSTDNWDIVKNTTEVMVFAAALTTLTEQGAIKEYDRVFKMSGRYQLTENFDPSYYDTVPRRIVVLERKRSQFPIDITGGMDFQYMSRLWSWPANETQLVINSYNTGFMAMAERLHAGGYFDIEHMLFAYLPKNLVTEIPRVGLTGLLGPNGNRIED